MFALLWSNKLICTVKLGKLLLYRFRGKTQTIFVSSFNGKGNEKENIGYIPMMQTVMLVFSYELSNEIWNKSISRIIFQHFVTRFVMQKGNAYRIVSWWFKWEIIRYRDAVDIYNNILFVCLSRFHRWRNAAMKPHEIQEKLGLTRIRDRNWYVQPSCATTGDGLYEGLTWLTSNHKLWAIS